MISQSQGFRPAKSYVLSADIAHDTPNLVNPSDDGPVLFYVPAGSLFRVFIVAQTVFDVPGQLLLVAGEGSGTNTLQLAAYKAAEKRSNGIVEVENPVDATDAGELVANLPRWAHAKVDCVVCAAFYPDNEGSPATGAATILCDIVTP